jgi:hypothetical protein
MRPIHIFLKKNLFLLDQLKIKFLNYISFTSSNAKLLPLLILFSLGASYHQHRQEAYL